MSRSYVIQQCKCKKTKRKEQGKMNDLLDMHRKRGRSFTFLNGEGEWEKLKMKLSARLELKEGFRNDLTFILLHDRRQKINSW